MIRFMGVERQQMYLRQFQSFSPPAQQAVRDIYTLAHQRRIAEHMVLAMQRGLELPEIARLTLQNLATRVALRAYQNIRRHEKVAALQEKLADFHAALTEFMAEGTPSDAPAPVSAGKASDVVPAFKSSVEPQITTLVRCLNSPERLPNGKSQVS